MAKTKKATAAMAAPTPPIAPAVATPEKVAAVLDRLEARLAQNADKKPPDLVAFQSTLLGRMQMLNRAGLQYGGKRDIGAVAGYIKNPTFEDFESYYCRNEIGGRVIEAKAKTTWKTPPEVTDNQKGGETAFSKAVESLAKRIQLWSEFEVADRRSGIGRYGILLIGTKGTDDRAMVKPMQPLRSPDDVIYVKAYDEKHARIKTWVTDPGNERFGLPETYEVTLTDVPNFTKTGLMVHASRVLHIAEDADDRVYGRPRLARVLNRIFDLDKIAGSAAESFWQAVARILQGKIDPIAEITDSELDALEEKLAEMVHDLRRQFTGQGVELNWLNSQVTPVKDVADFYFALIAIGSNIPRRILFGNESGELASSTDQATYFGMINERQEHFAEPQFVRAFVDRLIKQGALPAPKGGEYDVNWEPLFELTELEQADANLKRAQTAAALTPIGGDPTQLVEIDDERNVWLVPKKPGNPDDVLPPAPTPAPPPDQTGGGGGGGAPTGSTPPDRAGGGGGIATQYSDAEPRDEQGRWTSGGGGDTNVFVHEHTGERDRNPGTIIAQGEANFLPDGQQLKETIGVEGDFSAVLFKGGVVYRGDTHYDALRAAFADGKTPSDIRAYGSGYTRGYYFPTRPTGDARSGFYQNVTREAWKAHRAGENAPAPGFSAYDYTGESGEGTPPDKAKADGKTAEQFNPNHDPGTGEFAPGSGGSGQTAEALYGSNAGFKTGMKAHLGGHVVIYQARAQGTNQPGYLVMHEPSSNHVLVRSLSAAKAIMKGVAEARTRDEAATFADILPHQND